MDLLGIGQVNCFRTHNELTMGLLGKCPLAPSESHPVHGLASKCGQEAGEEQSATEAPEEGGNRGEGEEGNFRVEHSLDCVRGTEKSEGVPTG